MSAYTLDKDFDSRLRFTDVSTNSTTPYHSSSYSTHTGTRAGIPTDYDDRSSYVKSHDPKRPIAGPPLRSEEPQPQFYDHSASVRSHNFTTARESYDSPKTVDYKPVSSYQSQLDSRLDEQYHHQPSPSKEYPAPEYASLNKTSMSNPRPSERFEVRVTPLSSKATYSKGPPDTSRGPGWATRDSRSPTTNLSSPYSPEKTYHYDSSINSSPSRVQYNSPEVTQYNVPRSPTSSTTTYHEQTTKAPSTNYNSYRDNNKSYPEAAQSRLVYTGPVGNFGYAQSRPMGSSSPPTPPSGGQMNYSKPNYRNDIPTRGMSSSPSPPLPPPPPSSQHSPPPQQHHPPQTKILYDSQSTDYRNPRPFQHPSQPVPEPGVKGKEAEVDALTNLLMQNMEAAADPEFFGTCMECGKAVIGETNACSALDNIFHLKCFKCEDCGMCAKCARSIMGEDTGCKALDQYFHVDCFTCISCSIQLKGKPFYALEGRPYCEACYINTLEKCSICMEPITDRIVRATGKPYHSNCFVCVVCSKSLEGVPFTVDSASEIYCIEDFHRKFAPRCCVCEQPIMPRKGEEEAVRIVAMDRSFHMECYKCEDCEMVLSSESEGRGCYPLDDHILCKNCNARRIQQLTTKMTTEL